MNAAVGALLFAIALLGAITCRGEEVGGPTVASPPFGPPIVATVVLERVGIRPQPAGLPQGIFLAQASPDSEWVKQVLRLEYTTFCQTVKKPPQQLVDAINEALKQDPKTWMPVVIWFNAIAEKYQKAGCGDA